MIDSMSELLELAFLSEQNVLEDSLSCPSKKWSRTGIEENPKPSCPECQLSPRTCCKLWGSPAQQGASPHYPHKRTGHRCAAS